MSKFRIKLKLQGLEFEIEGTREDATQMSRSVGQQLAGLLQPVTGIIEGQSIANDVPRIESSHSATPAKKPRRRKAASHSAADGEISAAIDFKHSSENFGNPKQDWKTAEKAIWLIYVVSQSVDIGELATKTIVETFNKHFRQSGTVTTSNVTRDLGRLKSKEKPSPVGEDTTKTPPAWYLTEDGRKRAQSLVAEARGVQVE